MDWEVSVYRSYWESNKWLTSIVNMVPLWYSVTMSSAPLNLVC